MPSKNLQISPKYKALFIVSSAAQINMFEPIAKKLVNLDVTFINTNKSNKQKQIDCILQNLNLSHKTIKSFSSKKIYKILEIERPNIVILGHYKNIVDKLFINSSYEMNIPTLVIQDGIYLTSQNKKLGEANYARSSIEYFIKISSHTSRLITKNDYSWNVKIDTIILELNYRLNKRFGKNNYDHFSKIAVFGDEVKNILISEGIDSKKIIVTGNPKFDKIYFLKDSNCKQKLYEQYNISEDKNIILLLTQYFVEINIWSKKQREEFILAIVKAASLVPDTQLIIKIRSPIENEGDYKEILNGLPFSPIIVTNEAIEILLNSCSVAITVSSTAALEAMAIEKPVIIVDLFNRLNAGASFFKNSGALYIDNENEISSTINKAIYDDKVKEHIKRSTNSFLYQQAYLQDGKSTLRITNLIMCMINKNIFD